MRHAMLAATLLLLASCGEQANPLADARTGGERGSSDARHDLARSDAAVGDAAVGDAARADARRDGAQPGLDAQPDAGPPPGWVAPVAVSWESSFSLPPRDAKGFSILKPSADSRLIYVSASLGDDATAKVYSPSSAEIGSDPLEPKGPILAYKGIDAALAQARSGYPDWVLLRRGDSWTRTSTISARSGRSASERSLLGAYGPATTARPLIRSGTVDGLQFWKNVRFAAAVGLHFLAHQRDPQSTDFVGWSAVKAPSGFYSYTSDAVSPNRTILVEDCVFRFYSNNLVQGTEHTHDVVVRRCQFLDDYSASSHAQGMYTNDASLLLEENLFDHNGWFKQQATSGQNNQAEGQATMFNHNTYFTNTSGTIFRRNLFLRASSIGTKFTANPPGAQDQVMVTNVLLDDNLYVEGEIGVSAGGNTDNGTGHRFKNFLIANNVFIEIGRARPTNRSLGWGVDVIDWEGGEVKGNHFLHYGDATVKGIYAIHVSGHTRDLLLERNVVHGLTASAFAVTIDGDPKQNLSWKQNQLQLAGTQMGLVSTAVTGAALACSGNVYATDRTPTTSHFSIKGSGVDFAGWTSQTGETGAQQKTLSYPAPGRTVESYLGSLGQPQTLAAFVAEARKQSRGDWREAYTASAVNRYLRQGYLVSP